MTPRQNPRARVEALAESLLDSERDITVTDARRHLAKLADTDVQYAAAKYLQEAVNRNRRSKRREAEKEASRVAHEKWIQGQQESWERTRRRQESARRRAEADPLYVREMEEAKQYEDDFSVWRAALRDYDRTSGDPYPDPPTAPRTIAQMEHDGDLPRTWRSKKFDDFTEQDWVGFHDHGTLPSYQWDACYSRKKDRLRVWKEQKHLEERINLLAEEKLLAWTEELLGAEFRLTDGTLTSWGAATIEQHRERVEMFTKNATASTMGAGRHLQAVRDLEAAQAPTLNDLVATTVAA